MWVVTGATGFIGSQFVRELNQKGIDQILLVDEVSPEQRPLTCQGLKYHSFKEAHQWLKELKSGLNPLQIEWIVHMGANSSTTVTDWSLLEKQNLNYTKDLWAWCVKNQVGFVYASSAATYGDGSLGYSDQTLPHQLKTLNLYGESKRLFDLWALEQPNKPLNWWGLKFFNVYGPGEYHKESMSSVVYKAYYQIKETQTLKLFKSYHPEYKDGHQKRDFVYVKDVTRWIWELTQNKPASQILNMGYGQARTWVDLAQATFKAMNVSPHIEFIDMPTSIQSQYQYFTQADMTNFFSLRLSQPKYNLENGIQDYIQNYLRINDGYTP